MSADRLGRGFEALPVEEQMQVLRDHAIAQELLTKLLTAFDRLGVTFVADGLSLWHGEATPDGGMTARFLELNTRPGRATRGCPATVRSGDCTAPCSIGR